MNRRTFLATCAAAAVAAVCSAGALAANGGPPVMIRVEGAHKTLLLPRQVQTHSGWITKYGAPKGQCSASSAQGALDVATHGQWTGKWYSSYHEYFITSIAGEKPQGGNYWEIFLNNKAATQGACNLKLHKGDQLLFADTDGKEGTSDLKAPSCVSPDTRFKVTLLGYPLKGTSKPLAGVSITANGAQDKTNRQGVATVHASNRGKLVLRASPHGYIRTEAVVAIQNQACAPY